MIVLITARGHGYTLRSIRNGKFGFPTPALKIVSYDAMLRARRVPRATYIFSDIERLSPFELRMASELYRAMQARGLKCLNDPARVKSRFGLLRTLHREGINPFNCYRADEYPEPARFPVFIRYESDHGVPLSLLLDSQSALDAALKSLESDGIPQRGVVVTEYCAESGSTGLFSKWGAFRIGGPPFVDHVAVEKNWLVKYGKWDDLTDEIVRDEHDAVSANRVSAALARAFDLANIEFGRADFAIIGGETVIYEINTNPYIGPFVPDPKPLRLKTQEIARTRFGKALAEIDTDGDGNVSIDATPLLRKCRQWWRIGWMLPKYP
ncbi:MAG: hypothetical protein K2W78_12030 [Xanthobacteraceae bacterium]|nr:hypothetical protein [Xanthobacteraceae bacterium]